MAKRIQRKRIAGWRLPDGAVYVGRPTRWGNRFFLGRIGDARRWTGWYVGEVGDDSYLSYGDFPTRVEATACAVETYRNWAMKPGRAEFRDRVRTELAGKDLACWCPVEDEHGNPVPCHADVLLELANGGEA